MWRSVVVATLLLFSLTWEEALSQTCNTFHDVTGVTIFVEPGTDVCFRCAASNPQWTIEGSTISPTSTEGEVVNGVLRIFVAADVFSTTTLSSLSCSTAIFSVVFLTAFIPPSVTGVTTVNETDTLTLMCDNSGSLPRPRITWLGPDGAGISTDAVLTVDNIQRGQAGNYTCLLTNSINDTLSTTVGVTVQYTPDVSTQMNTVFVPRNTSVTLSCDYSGVPEPEVTWQHDGGELLGSTLGSRSELLLTAVGEDEGGVYTCTVSNLLGQDSVDITVNVQVPPDAVSGLSVVDQEVTTITLQWDLGDNGLSPITAVELEYMEEGGGEDGMERVDGEPTNHTLTGLRGNTVYNIDVYVINAIGRSEPSQVMARTDSEALNAPTITSFVAVSSTELRLEWEAPVVDTSSTAPIISWVVKLSPVDSSQGQFKMSSVTHILLSGLEKGTAYRAEVAGINEVQPGGQEQTGQFSQFMDATTFVDPPTAVREVTLTSKTPRSLRWTWDVPEDSGGAPVEGYRVEARRLNVSNGTQDFQQVANVTALEFTLTRENFGVTELTSYEIRVTAYNSAGLGDPVTANATTIAIGAPQPVLGGVNVTRVTSSYIVATWEYPGGTVDYYVIQYVLQRLGFEHANASLIQVEATKLSVEIHNLEPRSNYVIRIRSKNQNGESEWSPQTTFKTEDVLTVDGPTGTVEAGTTIVLECSIDQVQWLRNGSAELPDGATVDEETLTFDDPQPDDSGVYLCCRNEGDCAEFDLQIQGVEPTTEEPTEEDEEDDGVSTLVIIVVAVVGGVSLLIFLTVVVVALCYFCRKCRGHKLSVDKKQRRLTWIESAPTGSTRFVPRTRPEAQDSTDDAPSFDIPEDYQTHSSFNTLEKQQRIRRSPSPQLASGIAYAQLDFAQPVTGTAHGTTASGKGTQRTQAGPYESDSPTGFQFFPQDEPLARPGAGMGTRGVEDWMDAPHYANTVV